MEHKQRAHVDAEDINADLLLRSASGDRQAFDSLVLRNRRSVLNIAYRYVGDATEAEDLTQEAFMQLYRNRHRYRPTARFSTFLNRVVVNLCINEARRRRRRPAEALDSISDAQASADLGPERVAVRRELAEQVLAALQRLPDTQRMAVILSHYEGLSQRETAEALGCSAKAVEGLLHRARQALAKHLDHYVEDDV